MSTIGEMAVPQHMLAVVAANEEFRESQPGDAAAGPAARAGWDPYEVWRTRVKEARSVTAARDPAPGAT